MGGGGDLERKLLGLLTTFQCSARCRMCCFACGPDRRERIEQGHLLYLIEQASAAGFEGVGFTGGEPFLLGQDLVDAVAQARADGLTVQIVTNAYWAGSLDDARARLGDLRNAGLTVLGLSCDDQHQEHVPVERVKHAFEAALELGISVCIETTLTRGGMISLEWLKKEFTPPSGLEATVHLRVRTAFDVQGGHHGLSAKELLYRRGRRVCPAEGGASVILPQPEEVRLGGPVDTDPAAPGGEVNPPAIALDEGYWRACPMVLSHPGVAPDGSLLSCCSVVALGIPELTLGNTHKNSLASLLALSEDDLILNWLSQHGPSGIAAYLWRAAPHLRWLPAYASMCHLCQDLLTRPAVRRALAARAHKIAPAIAAVGTWMRGEQPC